MAKKVLAIILVIITLISCIATPASAATWGYGRNKQTITVVTKANWWIPGSESITISATKGVFEYDETGLFGRETGKTETKKEYGSWSISVKSTDKTRPRKILCNRRNLTV